MFSARKMMFMVVLSIVAAVLLLTSGFAYASVEITMAGYVFHDKDHNGYFDDDEGGLAASGCFSPAITIVTA